MDGFQNVINLIMLCYTGFTESYESLGIKSRKIQQSLVWMSNVLGFKDVATTKWLWCTLRACFFIMKCPIKCVREVHCSIGVHGVNCFHREVPKT